MSALAPYVVDAIVLEHRSPSQLARDHDISRSWIYRVLERFQEGGYEALEPRSRRPPSCSRQAGPEVQAEIVRLRTELIEAGHDGGPQTILYHLADRVEEQPSAATVWRVLKRHGLIMPQPQKRPKSSFIRFEAKLPNETWQVDATPWQLAVGRQVEILNFLDDHSRLHLAARAFSTIRAGDVAETFHAAAREFDLPAWAASRTSAGARIPAIADPGLADQAPVRDGSRRRSVQRSSGNSRRIVRRDRFARQDGAFRPRARSMRARHRLRQFGDRRRPQS